MNTYDSYSCNSLEKAYYRPIEAAIRWCNLISQESYILSTMNEHYIPPAGIFPQWPCLAVNAEKILYAAMNGQIPYGRDGKNINIGEQVARHRITVTHTDLKEWMTKYYPNQKPNFLFDNIEKNYHSGITLETYNVLLAEKNKMDIKLKQANDKISELNKKLSENELENLSLKKMLDKFGSNEKKPTSKQLAFIKALLYIHYGQDVAENPRQEINKDSYNNVKGEIGTIREDFINFGLLNNLPSGDIVRDWVNEIELDLT